MKSKAKRYMLLLSTPTITSIALWLNIRLQAVCDKCATDHRGLFYTNLIVNIVGLMAAVHLAWHLLAERQTAGRPRPL